VRKGKPFIESPVQLLQSYLASSLHISFVLELSGQTIALAILFNKNMQIFTSFMKTAMVKHKQLLRNNNGTFRNLDLKIVFSEVCTVILEKVAHFPNRDMNDHYYALSIWMATYWKCLSAV
jgi:hypothetical protein